MSPLLTQTAAEYCEGRGWACEPVLEWTENERLAAVVGWLSDVPLRIAVVLAVGWLVNVILRRVIGRLGARMVHDADRFGDYVPAALRASADPTRTEARASTISSIARSVATSIMVLVVAGVVLSLLGVSLAALFASAGVVGVALGFGAQTLVRDVLAGWFIIVEDRYGVGDTIDAGAPAIGVVERVTLRSTRLRDINGTVWHVANGEILRVGNLSQNWSRAVIDVVVDPSADIDRACELLEQVGNDMLGDERWGTRLTGEPDVLGVQLMEPTGITLRVMTKTAPASQFPVEREYRRRVLRAFEAAGIPLALSAALRGRGGSAALAAEPPVEDPPAG